MYDSQQEAAKLDIELHPKATAGLPLGMSPNHPYIQLFRSKQIESDASDRLQIFNRARYLAPRLDATIEAVWLFDWHELVDAPLPTSVSSLVAILPEVIPQVGYIRDVVRDRLLWEATRLAREPAIQFGRDDLLSLKSIYHIERDPGDFSRNDDFAFEKDLRTARAEVLRQVGDRETAPGADLANAIESYVLFSHNNLLLNTPDLRRRYEATITEGFAKLSDPADRMQMAINVLWSGDLPQVNTRDGRISEVKYVASLRDPEFRSLLCEAVIDGMVARNGLDDGSPEYRDRVYLELLNIASMTQGAVRFEIMSKLADRLELQQQLAFDVRDMLMDKELVGLDTQNAKIIFGEISIDTLNSKPKLTKATIDFIKTPLTLESAKAYVAKLDSEYTHILHGEDTGVIEEAKLDATETMHRNFWNLPLHARTLYMEKILFPVKTDYLGDDATFDNFRKKALDFVLPVSDVKSVARRFLRRIIGPTPADAQALLNRDVAESYLDACEEGEQRLMLTAMVVANEPSQDAEDARPGRAACRTLEAIGPAGTKLAQAIHSHEGDTRKISGQISLLRKIRLIRLIGGSCMN